MSAANKATQVLDSYEASRLVKLLDKLNESGCALTGSARLVDRKVKITYSDDLGEHVALVVS